VTHIYPVRDSVISSGYLVVRCILSASGCYGGFARAPLGVDNLNILPERIVAGIEMVLGSFC
jgi:hypothetical protein